MRFDIEPEHDVLLSVLERFVESELRPLEVGADWIMDDQVPPDVAVFVRRRSADLGLYAPDYPVEVGGQGLPQAGMVLLRERAYSLDSRLASLVTAGPEGPTGVLLTATHEQQERYLRPLVEARAVRCLALTEPDAGSDAGSIRTRAERVPGGWELTGSKHFISNAAIADFAIVFARTPGGPRCGEGISGFIVERCSPGFVIGRPIEGMSADVVQHEVMFDRCFVPDANLLGGEANLGWGYHALLQYFALGRLALASAANGMALRAFRIARDYATTRRAFGSTISRFQYIQGHLVDSHVQLRASQLLTYEAAAAVDGGQAAVLESSVAKLHATETAFAVVDRMIQVLGGLGWTREMPLERMLRQLRAYRIVDGTSELQKVIIARSLLPEKDSAA